MISPNHRNLDVQIPSSLNIHIFTPNTIIIDRSVVLCVGGDILVIVSVVGVIPIHTINIQCKISKFLDLTWKVWLCIGWVLLILTMHMSLIETAMIKCSSVIMMADVGKSLKLYLALRGSTAKIEQSWSIS